MWEGLRVLCACGSREKGGKVCMCMESAQAEEVLTNLVSKPVARSLSPIVAMLRRSPDIR